MKKILMLTGLALACLASGVVAAPGASHVMMTPSEIKWGDPPPGLPNGSKMGVLSGNPGEPGPFVLRAKLPPGYKIPAHTHPSAEHITVLSGGFGFGMGDKLDPAQGKIYPAGSYIEMPPGATHFVWTKQETVIQVHGMGPFAITYVNPADDPRNAAAPPAKKP
jgi:hypothetical protein